MASMQNQSTHSASAELAADALDATGNAARTIDAAGPAGHALEGASATDEAHGSAGKTDDAERAGYASRMAARHGMVGPPDLWEMKRRFQIGFLKSAGLRPDHRLLDLGCGTLRGGIPLIEYLAVGHYTGVDVRPSVLQEGRRELEEAGLVGRAPQLVCCEDLRDFDAGRRFDVIWAFAVLIHMSDSVLDTALAAVARHIESSGVFYATVNVGERSEGTWQGFPRRNAGRPLRRVRDLGLGFVEGSSAEDLRTSRAASARCSRTNACGVRGLGVPYAVSMEAPCARTVAR